jgi:hypothetical protein
MSKMNLQWVFFRQLIHLFMWLGFDQQVRKAAATTACHACWLSCKGFPEQTICELGYCHGSQGDAESWAQ